MIKNHKKKCLKGGQHFNRLIQALCLSQKCKCDRLLCFYCIHQNHQGHEIVYLLEGLGSAIQKVNVNSRVQNKEKHEKFMQKKIRKINHGWKSLYRIFERYIKLIQKNIEPQIQVIRQSFDQDSAKRIVQQLTDQNTSEQVVQRYVEKIRLIKRYDLSDLKGLELSTQLTYEGLKNIYKKANEQIEGIMERVVRQVNIFSSLNQNIRTHHCNQAKELKIDNTNRINIVVSRSQAKFEQSICIGDKNINNQQNSLPQSNGPQLQFAAQNGNNHQENARKNKLTVSSYQNYKLSLNKNSNVPSVDKLNINSSIMASKDKNINKNLANQNKEYAFKPEFINLKRLDQEQRSSSNQKMCFQMQQGQADDREFYQVADQKYDQAENRQSFKTNHFQRYNQFFLNEQYQQNLQLPQNKYNLLQQHHYFQQQQQQFEDKQYSQCKQQQDQQSSSLPAINNKYLALQFSSSQQSPKQIIAAKGTERKAKKSPASQFICLPNISITSHCLKNIEFYLSKIPQSYFDQIQSLELTCNTTPLALNQKIVSYILKMKSLKKLACNQAIGLLKEDFIRIATNLIHLEYLVLEQFYNMDQDLAQIVVNSLRKLRKFNYTSDSFNNLRFKEDNTEFMAQIDGSTELGVINKLLQIHQLETISFESIYRLNQIKSSLSKMKRIVQLSIICHQKQLRINPIVDALLSINGAKQIVHLELKQCSFKESSFIQVIKNCKTLKSLVLNKCSHVKNQTIAALKCQKDHLKQLDFMQQDDIRGDQLEHLSQLQTLGIKACWQIQEQVFGQNISKLSKLKYLNLNFNRYWLTQKIFNSISKLKSLETLQIDNNKVKMEGLVAIRNLQNIQTLVLGNTELQDQDIIAFLSITKSRIKKLSLKRQIYNEKSSQNQINNKPLKGFILEKIASKVQHLTHLSIKGMQNVRLQHIQALKNLKCISTDENQLDSETINHLQQSQISLYVGYTFYHKQCKPFQHDQFLNKSQRPQYLLEQSQCLMKQPQSFGKQLNSLQKKYQFVENRTLSQSKQLSRNKQLSEKRQLIQKKKFNKNQQLNKCFQADQHRQPNKKDYGYQQQAKHNWKIKHKAKDGKDNSQIKIEQ